MNAPNPSSNDKDVESLRRAQRAHEPSMEEILASIRSIIADDKDPPAPNAATQRPSAPPPPQIVFTNTSMPPVRAAPLASEPASAPAAEPVAAAIAPKVVWEAPPSAREEAPSAAPVAVSEPAPDLGEEDEAFASPETQAAVASSFEALSASVVLQSSAVIERLTREMLRPMLKNWLDDNLPSIVERLVRAEIQRVARGR